MMGSVQPIDCELLRPGWAAQPANTASALAFVIVGIGLWRQGSRLPAAMSVATGIGSVLFHAAPGGASSWAHDVTLYGLVAVALVRVWHLLDDAHPPVAAGAVFGAGLVVWALSRTGGPWCYPASLLQGHALWHVLAAVAVGLLYREPDGHTAPAEG